MTRDLAIDLGTANTLVFREGHGIVFNEPTVIAMNQRTGDVLALGEEAWDMIGRTPAHVVAVRPLRHGAITDFDITQRMIKTLLRRVGVGRLSKPRVLICVPSAITEVERRAVEEAAGQAGARDVGLVEEPLAAAIGAGLPIHEPIGNLVVDIGGGTSEVAGIFLGGIVSEEEIREALSEIVRIIVDGARDTLSEAPPELAHDVLETGMWLTGGGSLLKGTDMRLARECEVPVHLTDAPPETVALGAGRMLEHLAEYKASPLF